MADRELLIVSGPNGAGKTTLANQFLRSTTDVYEYMGADLIAAELSPLNPTLAQFEAGREFLRRTHECLSQGRNCLIESTLSGKSLRRIVQTAQSLSFRIRIHFLFVDSASLSLARVRQRVAKGGHDVPESDVRRRFLRSLRNFWGIYRQLADYWTLTYNGVAGAQDVAFGTPQFQFVLDKTLFQRFLSIAEGGHASHEQ